MLYLLKSNNYYKIGYTTDKQTMVNRISSYRTHNPDMEMLGTRQGDKTSDKKFNQILKDSKSCQRIGLTEWYSIDDEELIEELKRLFTEDAEMISQFGQSITFEESDYPTEEIYTQFIFTQKNSKYILCVLEDCAHLYNAMNRKNYKLEIPNFKLFRKDYEIGECPDYFGGVILEDGVIFNRKYTHGDEAFVYNIESPLYNNFIEKIVNVSEIWYEYPNKEEL